MTRPRSLVICECFARDGLQNEDAFKIMGFTGNACTEDLVAMLGEMGGVTGIGLAKLLELGRLAEQILGRELHSHVVKTGPVKH